MPVIVFNIPRSATPDAMGSVQLHGPATEVSALGGDGAVEGAARAAPDAAAASSDGPGSKHDAMDVDVPFSSHNPHTPAESVLGGGSTTPSMKASPPPSTLGGGGGSSDLITPPLSPRFGHEAKPVEQPLPLPLLQRPLSPSSEPGSPAHPAADSKQQQPAPGGLQLWLPDMFSSIMSVEARMNPHYKTVKPEADEWIARTLGLTEKQSKRNAAADFTHLVSWWAPNADAEALRTLVDWNHWAFPWDDQFDEGHLKEDLTAAAEDIIHMTSILDDSYPTIQPDDKYPIRYAFQQNWYRIRKRASPVLQHRYKMYLKHYMLGVLRQVSSRARDPRSLSVDDYLRFRRGTIGAMPCFCLVEYAEGIDLPQEVVDHPSVAACQEVAVDLVLIDNDVLSYRKDLVEGESLNLINVLRHSMGLTLQGALDEIDRMLTERYRRWYRALAEMPSWGSRVDKEVLRYLDGCRLVALGSLIWSFHTGRYFKGDEGELVKREQRLWIPDELLAGINDGQPLVAESKRMSGIREKMLMSMYKPAVGMVGCWRQTVNPKWEVS